MAKDEDLQKEDEQEDEESPSAEDTSSEEAEEAKEETKDEKEEAESESEEKEEETKEEEGYAAAPTQLGHKRFVYAAYLAGGILVAFISTKLIDLGWARLEAWKPQVGEPKDEITAPLAALIGGIVAWKYWRDQKVRKLAEEVAEELTKVTWPTRKEVTNSTTVVIVATAFATIFFFLMDKFWSFVTNLVYGS